MIITLGCMFFLWIVAKTIQPQLIKDSVTKIITTLTSQPTQIKGQISWEFFPHPAIKLNEVHIGEKNTHYSLNVDNIRLNLKLIPLISGKTEFNVISINGAVLTINNTLLPVKKVQSASTKSSTPTAAATDNDFFIDQFSIDNSKIIVLNPTNKIVFENLKINTESLNLTSNFFPLQVKTRFTVSEANIIRSQGNALFKGKISLSSGHLDSSLKNFPKLNGQLSINKLALDRLNIKKLNTQVKLQDGLLFFNPLKINLYQGLTVGDLRYEFRDNILQLNQAATNIDSATLSHDLFNKTLFKGKLDFSLHAQTRVHDFNSLNTLQGSGTISLKDGSMEAINLNRVIKITSDNIHQLLKGKKDKSSPNLTADLFASPDFFQGNTPFKLFTLQYRLENHYLYNDALLLQTDTLHVKGEGKLHIDSKQLDSHLQVTLLNTEATIFQIQQLLGNAFPLIITGTLTKPLVLPDLKQINPILTRIWIKNKLTKPVQEMTHHLIALFK